MRGNKDNGSNQELGVEIRGYGCGCGLPNLLRRELHHLLEQSPLVVLADARPMVDHLDHQVSFQRVI